MVLGLLTGCGDVTGESPKIEGMETPKAEATAPPAAPAAPEHVPAEPIDDIAGRAFGLPVVERSTTAGATADAATSPAAGMAVAEATSSATITEPALTAPDPALAEAAGLYLRQAHDAKVHWRMWNKEAFAEAQGRNVPTLIVLGAAWSQDARHMDKVVFAEDAVAEKLNDAFVPVRVDADERPDIWARYRLAYEMINKVPATMPLLVFAMPDGRPFDIVSAVPAQSQGDVVGLEELMAQASTLYKDQQDAVTEQAGSIEEVLAQLLAAPRASETELSKDVAEQLAAELTNTISKAGADGVPAGRVGAFLLHYAADTNGAKARTAASDLLLSRFRSSQRDHVMGGYFSRVPGKADIQFGKLLSVQTEMISANARAFAQTDKGLHREAVTEVMRFCHDWLEDANGGFYTAQEPGVEGEEEGAYFTWTQEEIEQIAGDKAAATVFFTYLNAQAGKKTMLHVTDRLQKAADAAGVSYAQANKDLDTVRKKLTDARMAAEKVPMVDKSMLAGWNADMVCAYLEAVRLANYNDAKEFALKTADRIIEQMVSEKDGVARVLYKGRASNFGYLEDNVKVAAALVECYNATQQKEYLESALSIMNFVETRFVDKDSGLYRDFLDSGSAQAAGLLRLKRLPLEDDISRNPNAVAALTWYKLAIAQKDPKLKERGDRLVKAALERRSFSTEAMSTWGEAALVGLNGEPKYKN